MSHASTTPSYGADSGWRTLADHWGLVLCYGLITLGLGVVLAVWPDETLRVCAVLIGIQLLVGGVVRIVTAVAASGMDAAVRVLVGLSGALALIVGLLCLREPLQTFLAIGLVLGAWWVVAGVVDVLTAIWSPTPGRRGWEIAGGVVTLLAGGFLLVNPELSLGVLVLVLCGWLIVMGLVAVVVAFRLRAERAPEPRGAPAPV